MVMTLSILAATALGAVICALLMGWGGLLSRGQRLGLAMTASGLVLAAIPRFQGQPPGWGDVLMLVGFVAYLGATYLPAIARHIDGLDGAVDGKILGANIKLGQQHAKAARQPPGKPANLPPA